MNMNRAASVLSALLYAQGLLGFAGAASVILKDGADTGPVVQRAAPAPSPFGR